MINCYRQAWVKLSMIYIIFQPVCQIIVFKWLIYLTDYLLQIISLFLTWPISNLSVYLFTSVYLLVFICLSYCLYGYSFHFWLFFLITNISIYIYLLIYLHNCLLPINLFTVYLPAFLWSKWLKKPAQTFLSSRLLYMFAKYKYYNYLFFFDMLVSSWSIFSITIKRFSNGFQCRQLKLTSEY